MRSARKEANILRENERLEKPEIPELPKTIEDLGKLLIKSFKISRTSNATDESGGEYHPGGVAVADMELECPFCKMKFEGLERSGCSNRSIFPNDCPNCKFPINVIRAMDQLRNKSKEGGKG